MTILIFIVSLLGAIAIGVPIAWALLLCGISLMFWMDIFDVQILAQTLVNGADSFSLLAIPFFVLAGEIMNAGGQKRRQPGKTECAGNCYFSPITSRSLYTV